MADQSKHPMWNDTDTPLAIFFTFRTYGTWLHGDERLSVDRHNNKYGGPKIEPIEHLKSISAARLKSEPVYLDARRRAAVEAGIRKACARRGWHIYAINVRTNHVHVVIAIGSYEADRALAAIKSYATRELRERDCCQSDQKPWAEKGSCRRLWNEKHIYDASNYVNNGQGGDLPKFD